MNDIQNDTQIVPLQEVGLQRWFEIGPPPADAEVARRQLAAALEPTALRRPQRWVALQKGQVVARLLGYQTPSGRLTLGWPVYRAGFPAPTRAALAEQLVGHCIAGAQANPEMKFLETKPADDVPDLDLWLGVLVRMGFQPTACAHLYTRPLTRAEGKFASPGGPLQICRGDEVALATLQALYVAYMAQTQDRADAEGLESAEYLLRELTELPAVPHDLSTWQVGFLDGQSAGLVACAPAPVPAHGESEGWILSIGVVAGSRQRGAGDQLLKAALRVLAQQGVTLMNALIDDQNTASISLHRKNGFSPLPDRYLTYRRRLPR